MQPTKSWKNPQMLLWKTQIHLFFLTAWVAQKTQKEELMFQNVAYRPTVQKTGAKGQLISKCLLGVIVSTKKPTKFL